LHIQHNGERISAECSFREHVYREITSSQTILAIPVVLAIAVGYPLLVVFSLPKLFAPPPIRRAAIGGAAADD